VADRVIVVGVRRGGSLIRASELQQMTGRAGRRHGGEATVELIVDEKDAALVEDMLSEDAVDVQSTFSDPDMVATALMPEIDRGTVTDAVSAKAWCARSMCAEPAVEQAIELLCETEAVIAENGSLRSSAVGTCAARYYFHPADVAAWKNNFSCLFELGLEDDEAATAWALGNVPFDRIVGDVSRQKECVADCRHRIPIGLETMSGSLLNVFSWWSLMGGPPAGSIRPACIERRKQFGRYKAALRGLNDAYRWDSEDFLDEVELRVRKNIGPHLVPLCRFSGITKTKAEFLYDLGVRDITGFERVLNAVDDPELCESMQKALSSVS